MPNKKKSTNYRQEAYGPCPTSIDDHPFYGYNLDPEQKDFVNAILNPEKLIVVCDAVAGCGKTTCAVGAANLLVQHGNYDGIYYIMSPYGESRQGYLPGSITEKSSVYFEPLYQALISCNLSPNVVINNDSLVNQKFGDGYVTCLTHTFVRGSTFENKVVIIDECANYTVAELKKTLTRISDSCKVIMIGHHGQIDIPNPKMSGFMRYLDYYKDKDKAQICELKTNHRGWISQSADALED